MGKGDGLCFGCIDFENVFARRFWSSLKTSVRGDVSRSAEKHSMKKKEILGECELIEGIGKVTRSITVTVSLRNLPNVNNYPIRAGQRPKHDRISSNDGDLSERGIQRWQSLWEKLAQISFLFAGRARPFLPRVCRYRPRPGQTETPALNTLAEGNEPCRKDPQVSLLKKGC
ncbi:hypothetical protein CEXT_283541 [Caerostris extrusa]|uniref:Uncharacterized protein n=1 Tax=Caerostris extrusa TaxID=172846 RepID=A0AAV4WRP5_CAEEX|nr:hypothetical protein CEXT_283541 [Caerostris extrusa]